MRRCPRGYLSELPPQQLRRRRLIFRLPEPGRAGLSVALANSSLPKAREPQLPQVFRRPRGGHQETPPCASCDLARLQESDLFRLEQRLERFASRPRKLVEANLTRQRPCNSSDLERSKVSDRAHVEGVSAILNQRLERNRTLKSSDRLPLK